LTALALLRLLQVTDSSFPVGGYAYSHGVEWLVSDGRVGGEAGVQGCVRASLEQTLRWQVLPSAAAAYRSTSTAGLARADHALDASIAGAAEREGGRAMGRRLLEATNAMMNAPGAEAFQTAMRRGDTPGQFATAFAVAARDFDATEEQMLAALGYSTVGSVIQASVRLGVIGADGAARLLAGAAERLAGIVAEVVAARRLRIGAWTPELEVAVMLQPALRFRMFAS